MKILLFFIVFIGILCREVFTCNFADENKDKCRTLINEMKKYSTESEYSEDKLKANFRGLSKELDTIFHIDKCNKYFFNSMKNAKEFFENIGKDANKNHIQNWLQQISIDFNTFAIECDLLDIWERFTTYPRQNPSEKLKGMCDQLAKIQTHIRNDTALNAVLKSINNAEKTCKNFAAKRSDISEFTPVFLDTLLTVKKAFYEEGLNAKIGFINEMGMKKHEALGIVNVFRENHAAFKKLVNCYDFKEDKLSKEYILNILAHKPFEKVNELKMVQKLKELIQTAKSFIGMEKTEKFFSEIIEFRRNTRKEMNAIIGELPEYNTEFGKTFYKMEIRNLLAIEDKKQFFTYFFWVDEMEKHLNEIIKAFLFM